MMVIVPQPIPTPLYSTLGDIKLILDATGLRDNTSNSYGQVSGGTVQFWKTISPSPLLTFGADPVGNPGEASLLKFFDGYIEYPGYVSLAYDNAAGVNYFDFLSFASPATNIKHTITMVMKIGQEEFPNVSYSFLGTNAGTQGAKGDFAAYDDRSGYFGGVLNRRNAVGSYMTKGSVPYVISANLDNGFTPNVPFVYTQETNLSLPDIDKRKCYINNVLIPPNTIVGSLAVVTSPTYALQIGAGGNSQSPLRGWISHVIIQNRTETTAIREEFVKSLLPFKQKQNSTYFYNVDESIVFDPYDTLPGTGRYCYLLGFCSPPSNRNKVVQIFSDGDTSVSAGKFLAMRTSTDRGRSFGAQVTIQNIGSPWSSHLGTFGYDAAGRLHGLTDAHTTIGIAGGGHRLYYHYSDDDGTNWTHTDISSILPVDGMLGLRINGSIFEHAGFMWACASRNTAEGNNTSAATYLFRKPIGSSVTWTTFTLSAPTGSPLLLFPSLAPLGADSLVAVTQNETTKEWNQRRITSITTTPIVTNDGDITFGESRSGGTPVQLSWFDMNGQRVIACWLNNRDTAGTRTSQVVFGLAVDIEANGIAGWNNTTKVTYYTGTQVIQWGRVLHYDNNFNAIASFSREQEPVVNTDNTVICFRCPSHLYYETRRKLTGVISGP
jgi:hypothetical protein